MVFIFLLHSPSIFLLTSGSHEKPHSVPDRASTCANVACFLSLYCDDCRLTHMDFIGFEENLKDTDVNMGFLQISAQKYMVVRA